MTLTFFFLTVFLPAWNNLQGLKYWLPPKAEIFWHHLLVLPQAASGAALLSSALGCLSLQIFPKYRYLKVKRDSILPSTWWSHVQPLRSSMKTSVTLRNAFEWFCLFANVQEKKNQQLYVCCTLRGIEEKYNTL